MEKTAIAILVQKARTGDEAAMGQLLELAHGSVIFQCRKIMQHPEDAADMAQEVLLQVYQNLDKLQDPEKFLSWANRIAAYMCINQRQRHPKDLQFLEDENGHSFVDTIEDADRQHVPDAAMDNAETKRLVTDLIDALPEAQRTAIYLYYYSEMSIREIAALTGVSENTVKSRLNYGRKALKDGVLGYEKDGIKLYTLSPLPFLLFLLRSAAESQADPTAASAAAKTVLTGGAAAAAGAAGASGTAVGSAAATEATAAAGTAAGTGGILGTVSVKVAAAVLAGVVAVGGIAAVIANRDDAEPTEPSADSSTVQEEAGTDSSSDGSRWIDPVPAASYTMTRKGVMGTVEDPDSYIDFPVFASSSGGYDAINAFFGDLARSFNAVDNAMVAAAAADGALLPPIEEYRVVYQDGFLVSVHLRRCSTDYVPGQRGFTFDVQTGELLTLTDLTGSTDADVAQMLQDAVASSVYADYLTADNAPAADPADWDYVIRDGVVYYLWSVEPGLTAEIALPVTLPESEIVPVQLDQTPEVPAYTLRKQVVDTGDPLVEQWYELPLFDSITPGYVAINDYLRNAGEEFLPSSRVWEYADLATEEIHVRNWLTATLIGQDDRYLCLCVDDNIAHPINYSWEREYVTFDVVTGQQVSPRDLIDLTDEEITAIALDWIAESEYAVILEHEPFELKDRYVYMDGQIHYVWTVTYSFPRGLDLYIPLAEPNPEP